MKVADILRKFADMMDNPEGSKGLTPVEVEPGDNGSQEVFVAPLQAKLELLKKSAGVPSFYDNKESDELDDIKKLTGIQAVMSQEAGEDNDITG